VKAGAVSHLQVGAQLAGVALATFPFPAPERGPAAALTLCLAGAVLGIVTLAHNRVGNFSIYPEPKTGARLITTGPYALVRHPMYAALMLMMAGIAARNAQPLNWLGLALVVTAVATKAAREERFLRARFEGYEAYRARTRWFVPYLL
jgi:protein-S-isoprenylcysteine O-methyltransferase Ste14